MTQQEKDLWSLCHAKNVHPNTISKIRRDITFEGRKQGYVL